MATTSEPPRPLPGAAAGPPRGSARPLPTSGCAWTLPGVRSPRQFGARSPPRVPGWVPGSLVPKLRHGHGPCAALKVNPEPSAFAIIILLLDPPTSDVPPPSCAAPAAGAMGRDPSRCCRGAWCQHRQGTPGKWRCCRRRAGGAVGGRDGQGAGPLPAVTPPALPGDGSWHSRTLSRLSGGGGAGRGAEVPGGDRRCRDGRCCPEGCGGLHPAAPHCGTPLPGAPSTGCSPPKPLGRTPRVLPRCLPAPAQCEDGGGEAAPPLLRGCLKGPFVPPAAGRAGARCQDGSARQLPAPPHPSSAAGLGVTASAGTLRPAPR